MLLRQPFESNSSKGRRSRLCFFVNVMLTSWLCLLKSSLDGGNLLGIVDQNSTLNSSRTINVYAGVCVCFLCLCVCVCVCVLYVCARVHVCCLCVFVLCACLCVFSVCVFVCVFLCVFCFCFRLFWLLWVLGCCSIYANSAAHAFSKTCFLDVIISEKMKLKFLRSFFSTPLNLVCCCSDRFSDVLIFYNFAINRKSYMIVCYVCRKSRRSENSCLIEELVRFAT